MGEVCDTGVYTCIVLSTMPLAQPTIPVLRDCGWKWAGASAATGVLSSVASVMNLGWIVPTLSTFGSYRPFSLKTSTPIAMHLFKNGTRTQYLAETQMT